MFLAQSSGFCMVVSRPLAVSGLSWLVTLHRPTRDPGELAQASACVFVARGPAPLNHLCSQTTIETLSPSLPPSLPPSFLLLFQWCWVGLSFSFALQCPVAFEKIVQHTLQVLRAADQLLIWDEFSLSNLFEGTIFHREDWEQLLSTLMFSETMLVPHLRHSTVSCQCYAEASLTNHWS